MAYVTPQTSGSITRNVTSGVDFITEWKANILPVTSTNALTFTFTYYLKTTKSITAKFTTSNGAAHVTTTVPGGFGSTSTVYADASVSDGDMFTNSQFTSGGNYIEVSLSSGKHYVCSTTTPEKRGGSYAFAYGSDFPNPFTIKLDKWSRVYINGTVYAIESTTAEIPPINRDKRGTASMAATYLGDFAAIAITKKADNYKYTLSYTFGELSGVITEKTTASTVSWRVPWDFLSQFTSNSTQATGTLKCTTYDRDGEYYGETTSSFTVIIDANLAGPTFSPVVTDTNSTTTALTGNNKILIRYFSTAQVSSGAAAQGNATITSQTIENNGKTYSGSSATISNVENNLFRFVATDSRKFTNTDSYTAPFIGYEKLTCNLIVHYPTTAGDIYIEVRGSSYNSTFGAVSNTLDVAYRYKEAGGSYSDWTTIKSTLGDSGNSYYQDHTLHNLDYKKTYIFQARAIDKLMTVTSQEMSITGVPIFDWGQENFRFNVNVDMRENLNVNTDKTIYGVTNNGDLRAALTPKDSANNTVLGFGNYQAKDGDTYIYGNNIHLLANQEISLNGINIPNLISMDCGSWTPTCLMASNPIQAVGGYIKIGNFCIINFCYQAKATSTIQKIYFQGLPCAPDPNVKWQSGGGNLSGGTLGLDQTAFSGWTIELVDGVMAICGRSVGYRDSSNVATTETSGYVGVSSGATFQASGTIMYKIA